MAPFYLEVAFAATLLLIHSSAQFSCGSIVSEASDSSSGAVPIIGCLTTSGNSVSTISSLSLSGSDNVSTTTDSAGETVISNSAGVITIPSDLTTLTTITSADGQTITYTPITESASDITTTNSVGETIISNSIAVTTIPSGLTTPTTFTLSDGQITTYTPGSSVLSDSMTTDSLGETLVSDGSILLTIPTGLTTSTVLTESDGELFTFYPSYASISSSSDSLQSGLVLTSINSASQTIISDSAGAITIPTGVTTPIALTESDGEQTTFTPSFVTVLSSSSSSDASSSSSPLGFLIPVTTSVTPSEPTDTNSVIPCNLWFFSICIDWGDHEIGGWHIDLIGPNNVPTFPPDPPEGCNTESAELCATTTSYGVSTSGAITSTTTTEVESTCGTVYGCEVTATLVSTSVTSTCTSATTGGACATASTYPYVVYPKDGNQTDQVDAISKQLELYVGESSQIYTSTAKDLGVNYWQLPLNESAADELRQVSDVATVDPQCDPFCKDSSKCYVCYDPTLAFKYQDAASDGLQFVSWPPGEASPLNDRYYFDDSNGRGVTVYVLDTGATMTSPEFQNDNLVSSNNIRWIHVGTDFDGRQPNDDSAIPTDVNSQSLLPGHGTAMLSIIAGNTLGVAKKVSPVLVRMPRRSPNGLGFTSEDFLDGLAAISADITSQSFGVSAIVLLAHGFPESVFYRKTPEGIWILNKYGTPIFDGLGWITRCKVLLAAIASQGGLVVAGAGNEKGGLVTVWPAVLAKTSEPEHLTSLMVVGAISTDGQEVEYADDPGNGVPHVFAPGIDVTVAAGRPTLIDNGMPYRTSSGTSDASAFTVGLAAYFLSLRRVGKLPNDNGVQYTPEGFKNYIMSQAWVKASVGGRNPISIWNGMTLGQEQGSCRWDPNAVTKRLRGRENTCQAPSITPLTEQSLVCNDEANFPGHGDISGPQHLDFATRFCDAVAENSGLIFPSSAWPNRPTAFNTTAADHHGINYSYLIEWVEDCVTTVPWMNVTQPVPDPKAYPCVGLLLSDYYHCDNGGVGGFSQAGCVKYTFTGGLGGPPSCEKCTSIAIT